MLGSGRTELLRCIFGADPYDSGEILVDQKSCSQKCRSHRNDADGAGADAGREKNTGSDFDSFHP